MKYFIVILLMLTIVSAQNISVMFESGPFGVAGALVVDERGASLHERPTIRSRFITRLPRLVGVTVIMKTNIYALGTNHVWYYVYAEAYGGSKGWAKSEIFAGWCDFKPIEKIQETLIITHSMCGCPSVYFRIYSNGTYKMRTEIESYYDEAGKVHLIGKVYGYRDILLLTGKEREVLSLFGYHEGQIVGSDSWELLETESLTNISQFPRWAQSITPPRLGIFHILTGDNVNVREWPSTDARVLTRLRRGARVRLLQRSTNTHTVGDRTGFWAQVDTGVRTPDGNTIKGWMVDVFLREER